MDIVKICTFCLASVILIVILKEQSKEISVFLIILASVVILSFILKPFKEIIDLIQNLIDKSSLDSTYLIVILKVIGITYLTSFTKDICNDSGVSSLGTKVEIASKVIILGITIPLLTSVVNVITALI